MFYIELIMIMKALKNGQRNGAWTFYYPSGKLSAEGNYTDDDMSGLWKFYYENGKIKEAKNLDNPDEDVLIK